MATTDSVTRRFAAACGLLSQYDARTNAGPAAPCFVQQPAGIRTNNNAQQLTIFYGGMVVVLDGCTPEKAAELIRLAAATAAAGQGAPKPTMMAPALVDIPIARNASLRRFLSKRKDRAAAPVVVPDYDERRKEPEPEPATKGGKLLEVSRDEAASWLALGSLAWDDDPCTRAERRL